MRSIDLATITPEERRRLLQRSAVPSDEVRAGASEIVAAVRAGGDAALAAAGRRYGGGRPEGSRIPAADIARAGEALPAPLTEAIRRAADHVRSVHLAQLPSDHTVEPLPGISVVRRWAPLRRVGCYVPGGVAPLPSTLIMTVVPAQVAGVPSVAVAAPARRDGTIDAATLGAAAVLGVEEVHAMGGAQAISALAYGTETIAPVDKIVGPGNAWVTAAKLAVAAEVAIDMPAGPSEALVLADATAPARYVAADLLAQAEHGPDSPVALVVTDPSVAAAVLHEVEAMLAVLERADVIRAALDGHGLVVLAPDRDAAIAFADDFAPEHLSIHLARPAEAAERITGAGSVFVGPWAPEPVGDYASGANHVLPTGGLACSTGPLSTEDFGSWRQVQTLTRAGLAAVRPVVDALASAEGLTAHRAAVEVRFREDGA
jgi:histidinol dehydrogenase